MLNRHANIFVLSLSLSLIVCRPATLKVPDTFSTIGEALKAATAGDIIEITSARTFVEDLTIDKPLTIRGTTTDYPMILAANTAERFRHIGINGADRLGTVVRAAGVRLEHLQFANLDPDLNSEGISCALLIIAPNCTIRDCVITSYEWNPGDGLGCAVADLDLVIGGATPTNVVFESCIFGTNKFGLVSSWWIAPGIPPQISVRNCRFVNSTSSGIEMDSGIVRVEACQFLANPGNAIDVGGGNITVIDSLFKTNGIGGAPTIDIDLDPRWDDTHKALMPGSIPPGTATVKGCRFMGNGLMDNPVIRIHEGTLQADHCVFANNLGPIIWMDDGGEPTAPAQAFVNHCDLYNSVGTVEIYLKHTDGRQEIRLQILNSILYAGLDGFLLFENELTDPAQLQRMEVSWSALYEPGITQSPLPGTNNILVPIGDPPYVSTDPDSSNAFTIRAGSSLLTAGQDGTYMGSNGARLPVLPEPFPISIGLANKHPVICWDSVSGLTYQIQATSSLTGQSWQAVGTVLGTGQKVCWEDQAPGQVRFYRVVQQ